MRLLVFILLFFTLQFFIVEARFGGTGEGGGEKTTTTPGNLNGVIIEILINLHLTLHNVDQ